MRVTRGYGFVSYRARSSPWAIPAALGAGALVGITNIPFAASWLSVLPLALVMYLIAREPTPRLAFRTAFVAGLPWWTIHLFWLPQAFASFLNPQVVWAVIPLLWPAEAFVGAVVAYFARWIGRRPVPTLGALVCGWLLLEYWRAWYGSQIAFPWGMFGYTMVDTPLAQTASLGGLWLVSLLVMGMAAGLAALAWGDVRPLVVMLILWVAGFAYGLTRSAPPAPTSTALLVQGDIDPLRRFKNGTQGDLEVYEGLSKLAPPEALTVWPEAAVGLDDALKAQVGRLVSGVYTFNIATLERANLIVALQGAKVGALKGAKVGALQGANTGISNVGSSTPQSSATLNSTLLGMLKGRVNPNPLEKLAAQNLAAQNLAAQTISPPAQNLELGRSSKVRFVPFGEIFPLRDAFDFVYAPIFRGLGLGGSFGRGDPARLGQRVLVTGADRVGGYVCYDSGFPEVTRNLVRLGANVLSESTNDGWFGGGTGNLQHFLIDRMRAIETDRFVLRAANTGVTALVDPRGRVVTRLPLNQPGALRVQYARLETLTPYVRFGDWAVLLSALLIPAFWWLGRREHRLI